MGRLNVDFRIFFHDLWLIMMTVTFLEWSSPKTIYQIKLIAVAGVSGFCHGFQSKSLSIVSLQDDR